MHALVVGALMLTLTHWGQSAIGVHGSPRAVPRHVTYRRNRSASKLNIASEGEGLPNLCGDPGSCWPQIWIIGAQKAGSTSIYNMLKKGYGICGAIVRHGSPRYYEKETHIDFGQTGDPRKFTSLYSNVQRPQCRGRFMEATPNRLRDPYVSSRLSHFIPRRFQKGLRFVVMLREPQARDFSWYEHMLVKAPWFQQQWFRSINEKKGKHRSFPTNYEDYVSLNLNLTRKTVFNGRRDGYGVLWNGMYALQIQNWGKSFPRNQILVLRFSAVIAKPDEFIERIRKFLNLPKKSDVHLPKVNSHKEEQGVQSSDRLKETSCEVLQQIADFYANWNYRLYFDLEQDHNAGNCPDEEPPFGEFPRPYTCDQGTFLSLNHEQTVSAGALQTLDQLKEGEMVKNTDVDQLGPHLLAVAESHADKDIVNDTTAIPIGIGGVLLFEPGIVVIVFFALVFKICRWCHNALTPA